MANRISFRELIDIEELYVKEDPMSFRGVKASVPKATEHAPEGVYFLLDDSCVMLLSGKIYRSR